VEEIAYQRISGAGKHLLDGMMQTRQRKIDPSFGLVSLAGFSSAHKQ